jgi:hypothetical protein
MNIFATKRCPVCSARALDDKRVVKMVLETAQLLSVAMGDAGPYRPTHVNHPCAVWVRSAPDNGYWTFLHFKALCAEYTHRYGKTHKCAEHMEAFEYWFASHQGADWRQASDFVNCTPYKDEPDVHRAYQMYMCDKWRDDKRAPTWTNRQAPWWRRQHEAA